MNEAVYEFFATCLPGAEKLLADELHGLGVRKVRPLSGGASFFGAPEDALRACLWSRLAGRVNLTVRATPMPCTPACASFPGRR